jgi:hypothetical protein
MTRTAEGPGTRQDGRERPVALETMKSPKPPASSLIFRASETSATFRTRVDVGHFMARHVVSARTVKSWPGWREVELTPRAVLGLAQSLYDPHNWRITWRLHQCDDVLCVCRELLLS